MSPHPLLIANCLFGVPCSIFSDYTRHHWTGYQPVRLLLSLLSPLSRLVAHNSSLNTTLIVWPDQPVRQRENIKMSLSNPENCWQQWRPLLFLVRRGGESMVSRAGCGVVICLYQLYSCTPHCCTLQLSTSLSIPRHPHPTYLPPPQPSVTSLCKYEICRNNVTLWQISSTSGVHVSNNISGTIWHISSFIFKN